MQNPQQEEQTTAKTPETEPKRGRRSHGERSAKDGKAGSTAKKAAGKKTAQPKEKRLKTALEVIEQSKPKSIRRKPSAKSPLQRQKPAQNVVEGKAALIVCGMN